jgi:hypothetical protein
MYSIPQPQSKQKKEKKSSTVGKKVRESWGFLFGFFFFFFFFSKRCFACSLNVVLQQLGKLISPRRVSSAERTSSAPSRSPPASRSSVSRPSPPLERPRPPAAAPLPIVALPQVEVVETKGSMLGDLERLMAMEQSLGVSGTAPEKKIEKSIKKSEEKRIEKFSQMELQTSEPPSAEKERFGESEMIQTSALDNMLNELENPLLPRKAPKTAEEQWWEEEELEGNMMTETEPLDQLDTSDVTVGELERIELERIKVPVSEMERRSSTQTLDSSEVNAAMDLLGNLDFPKEEVSVQGQNPPEKKVGGTTKPVRGRSPAVKTVEGKVISTLQKSKKKEESKKMAESPQVVLTRQLEARNGEWAALQQQAQSIRQNAQSPAEFMEAVRLEREAEGKLTQVQQLAQELNELLLGPGPDSVVM